MKGIAAAAGMALAQAHIMPAPPMAVEKRIANASAELARFRDAVSACRLKLERLMEDLEGSVDSQTIEILDFQLLLLEDTDFIGKIEDVISGTSVNAEYAVQEASGVYISYLEGLTDNDYLKERSADVSDLSQRLTAVLMGADMNVPEPDGEYIAISADIAPSRVAELNKSKLKGIILEKGGITSHCVILSRSLGIPCLIRTEGILANVLAGDTVLLDAVSGEAVIRPCEKRLCDYEKFMSESAAERESLKAYINRESKTLDGAVMKVYANITTKAETEALMQNGGEGVGLFRSELLYMSQEGGPPSEEKQYQEYAETARLLKGRPLIIRTMDIGGDKQIAYMGIGKEENPFLGYRAIRICLDHPEIFKPQLAAVLRAGAVGNVSVMFPMITNIAELRQAKKAVEDVKTELTAQKIPCNLDMKIGIMIETPAAAFEAIALAKEANFFSIGTNDLSQYLFAADRQNAKLSALNSHFQPTLIRVINSVVNAAHGAGIEADICGQAAEIDALVPLWIAMGVDNLSVSIPRITAVRRRICGLSMADCQKLLDSVLEFETAQEVENTLKEFIEQRSFIC